jgi:hypothetical protein
MVLRIRRRESYCRQSKGGDASSVTTWFHEIGWGSPAAVTDPRLGKEVPEPAYDLFPYGLITALAPTHLAAWLCRHDVRTFLAGHDPLDVSQCADRGPLAG